MKNLFFFLLLMSVSQAQVPELEKTQVTSAKPDINNIANSCTGKRDDEICRTLSKAMKDYKDFEQRSVEVMLEKFNLGKYQIYTASGLSMLVNRRITIKQRSFFSDQFMQTLDIKENETIISIEYNF